MEEGLRKLGLTDYETKVYLTLLFEGTSKGGEISKKSKVPQGRTYEVLHKLAEKGFVQELKTAPKLFKPIDPKIAIKLLVNNKRKEIDTLEKTLPETLSQIKKAQPKPKTEEKITILHGKKVLEPLIQQEHLIVRKYFKRMFTFEYLPYEIIRAEKELMKKGVKFKLLGTVLNKETKSLMTKAKKYGYEVRYYPVEELRISIVDGQQSMINIINQNNLQDRTVILVESKELTIALENYFDSIWEKAEIIM